MKAAKKQQLTTPVTQEPGTGSKQSSEGLVKIEREYFKSVGGLDDAVGGRDVLIQVMDWAPKTAKLELVLNMMADPGRAGWSLEKLCKDAGLSHRDFLEMFREAHVTKALAEAHITMSKKLATVAADVTDKAVNHLEPCKCTTGGKYPAKSDCLDCRGTGEIYFRSSFPHQQLIFETSGLVKKGGGVSVNVNQQVAVGGGGLFDRFVKATDSTFYGEKVVEGELSVKETERSEDSKDAGAATEVSATT
jgi:hypothetical protein